MTRPMTKEEFLAALQSKAPPGGKSRSLLRSRPDNGPM
jgi:hypothetical protein